MLEHSSPTGSSGADVPAGFFLLLHCFEGLSHQHATRFCFFLQSFSLKLPQFTAKVGWFVGIGVVGLCVGLLVGFSVGFLVGCGVVGASVSGFLTLHLIPFHVQSFDFALQSDLLVRSEHANGLGVFGASVA